MSILEHAAQIEANAARIGLHAIEADAVGVRLGRQPARPVEQIHEALVLGPQGIGARESHLPPHLHGALQLEVGLLQEQHIIEWLERDLRSAAPPEGRTGRAHVVALPISLDLRPAIRRASPIS